jgi:hypothetical protein
MVKALMLLMLVASGRGEFIMPPCKGGLYETTPSRRTLAGALNGSSFVDGNASTAIFKSPKSLAISSHQRFGGRATALIGMCCSLVCLIGMCECHCAGYLRDHARLSGIELVSFVFRQPVYKVCEPCSRFDFSGRHARANSRRT